MPVLHVAMKDGERHIPFAPGLSVRKILDTIDIRLRSACGGVGACGLCLVHIEGGTGGNPTANKLINLSPDWIQWGIRLACQIRPLQDIPSIKDPAPTTTWRSLGEDEYAPVGESSCGKSTLGRLILPLLPVREPI